MSTRDTQQGISYRDVSVLQREIQRHFNGQVTTRITVPEKESENTLLWVHVTFDPWSVGRVTVRTSCTLSGTWPSHRATTIAGLMFGMLYDLNQELERRSKEASAAAAEQRRLF